VGVRWIDLVDPTPDELLQAVPQLDHGAAEILASGVSDGRDTRPFLESDGAAVAGLLLIPLQIEDESRFVYLELGVVATQDVLVTVRRSDREGRIVDEGVFAPPRDDASSVGSYVHGVIDGVAETYLDLVDSLYLEIDQLEDAIDELPGSTTSHQLSDLRHEMLHARKNVTATRAAVRRVVDGRLEPGDERLFPRDVEVAFADTYDTLVRATEELDVARDLLSSLRDHLQSKISETQNEVVKKLTAIASLVLVPTLITGFYGQNFTGVFDSPLWTVGVSIGLIVATTLLQLAFFRWKRWI